MNTTLLNHFFKLVVIAAMVTFVSCEKLDFVDPNGPTLEQSTVQTSVTGTEAGMRVDFEFYIRSVSVIGREVYYFEAADPRYTGELLGKNGSELDPSGFLLVRSWGSRYRVIRNCNYLIAKGDRGAAGFAKTIMAYQYLLNLNLTDENGIRIDVSGATPGPFVSKSAALAEIARLLDEGNTDLGAAGAAFSFKLSAGFAGFNTPATFSKFNRALRARVAAYQGDWNNVLTALGGSFISTSAPLSEGVYLDYGSGLNDQLNPIYEVPTATSIKLFAHPSFRAEAEGGDTRVSAKTITRPDTTTFDGLASNVGITVASSSTAPYPIIRNEELLLLRAEANINLNNLTSAEADINIVRNAAGLPSITLTSGNAIDELLKQRRYSLFLEGHRWIDLRRYNRLSTLPIDRSGDQVHPRFPRPSTEI